MAHSAPVHRAASNIRGLLQCYFSPLGQVYRAKYRLSYPRGRAPVRPRVSLRQLHLSRLPPDRARSCGSDDPALRALGHGQASLTRHGLADRGAAPRAARPAAPPRGAVAGAGKGGIGDRGCAGSHLHVRQVSLAERCGVRAAAGVTDLVGRPNVRAGKYLYRTNITDNEST
jgi:hypothetical protein